MTSSPNIQNSNRGKKGSYPAPRHFDNPNSSRASAFDRGQFPLPSKEVYWQHREAPHTKKHPVITCFNQQVTGFEENDFPRLPRPSLVTDADNGNGHAVETMTSFRVTATIHSHDDSGCRKDQGVSDKSHLSRVPRPPTVTDVTQNNSPHCEPNTAINLPPVVCSSVDEGEPVYIASTTPNHPPISPTPLDNRLTVNGTLSAISGRGSVTDTETITPRRLYSAVVNTPSPANKSPKPQRFWGCRPGPRCSKIGTPGFRSAGSSRPTRVTRDSTTSRTAPVTNSPSDNTTASYVSAIVMDDASPVAPSTVRSSEPRPEIRNVYPVKVIRHDNTFHKLTDWHLTDMQSKICILGDSNLCRIKTTPINQLHVECFPGAKIQHLDRMLS